jgi:uncharacterized protein (DUF1800 family)
MHSKSSIDMARGYWLWRMINTKRPLEEKMALFWHHVFATGEGKSEHPPSSIAQIETFRRICLSDMATILTELSKDPAMIFWLDNNENHKNTPNENYGRELLELFSMGVGNYTENDIKNVAKSFTGWTFTQPVPLYPSGQYDSHFKYIPEDHDGSEKTFLGYTGNFNGEDIIEIISKQKATASFISRHLYNFFVADEPQVPAWETVEPQDPVAIDYMVSVYMNSNGDIRSMLRALFNAEFFKESQFRHIKSPCELVVGIIKLVGTHRDPEPDLMKLDEAASAMGQVLMNPPTVEGWHTGKEWIDGGTLNERINFATNEVSDPGKRGIRDLIDDIRANSSSISPTELVNKCLYIAGPMEVSKDTRMALIRLANSENSLKYDSKLQGEVTDRKICMILQLIVSSLEYQFA